MFNPTNEGIDKQDPTFQNPSKHLQRLKSI